jgi:sugar-specific transcriptional regulator TrmB
MVILDGSPEASDIDDFLEKIENSLRRDLNDARAAFEDAERVLNRASDALAIVRRNRATLRRIKVTP